MKILIMIKTILSFQCMLKLQETQLLEHCKLKPRPQIQALVDIGKSDQCSWNAKQHGSMYDLFTTWFHEFRISFYLFFFAVFSHG